MKTNKYRWAYIGCHEKWTIIEVANPFYYVIGNGNNFEIKKFKKDWGRGSKLGPYLKETAPE